MSRAAIKAILGKFGLLGFAQEINFRIQRLNPRTTHSRVLVDRVFRQFIPQGSLVFDVGANHGDLTSVFLAAAPGVRVIAVDPQQGCVDDLRRRFAGRPVTVEWCALGDSREELELLECSTDDRMTTLSVAFTTAARFAGKHEWRTVGTVPVITLDDLIARHGVPCYCKIDTEGFELPVLRGLSTAIRSVSFEWRREALGQTRSCLERLSALGAYEFNAVLGQPTALIFPEWLPQDEFLREFNTVVERSGEFAWGDVFAARVEP